MPLGFRGQQDAHRARKLRQQERGGGEAAGDEFQNRFDLLERHLKLLDDFLDAGTGFQISNTVATGMRVSRNTLGPLRLSATLSTAGH